MTETTEDLILYKYKFRGGLRAFVSIRSRDEVMRHPRHIKIAGCEREMEPNPALMKSGMRGTLFDIDEATRNFYGIGETDEVTFLQTGPINNEIEVIVLSNSKRASIRNLKPGTKLRLKSKARVSNLSVTQEPVRELTHAS